MELLLLLILIAVGGLPLLVFASVWIAVASAISAVIFAAFLLLSGSGTQHCASSAKPGTMLTSDQFMNASCPY